MPKEAVQRRIDENLSVIREYLKRQFPGCTIMEERFPSRYYMFIATHGPPFKCHKLKVDWLQLWRCDYTSERTRSQLNVDSVASCMVRARHGYYPW
jgi:hypothetical protein